MRKNQAGLRNAIILAATIIGLLVIAAIVARGIMG